MADEEARDPSGSDEARADAGVSGSGTAGTGTPMTQQVGRIVLIVSAVLFTVFALFNAQHVDFNWVFGQTEVVQEGGERVSGGVPLIALLVGAFALGALIAWIATARRERRKRRSSTDD